MRARLASALILALSAAACGPGAKPANPAAATATEAAKPDPAMLEKDKQKKDKAAFDAALAAKDESKLDELANAGNGFALHHRAQMLFTSPNFNNNQSAYDDMEAAAAAGNADAELWLGSRMAEGKDGYPLKPNSGIMMVQKAADQGLGAAMLELGRLYQTTLMADPKKSREWYQKAADAGVDGAKDALAKLDQPTPDP